ncbi:DUF6431 domain-containing protein [Paenibacillus sp. Soil766]|uniref:DUF6431 domain-containing protein n=1 Tax=Paenibacillus sp. Soil766 TaxID=1736404 RepID=UPI001F3FF396|nr:DUF6431 domain-containing protein [Paenibacillus sp. Soil766]
MVPCPCCGEELKVIGSRKRISRNATGEAKVLSLRRLRCNGCRKIHHELPDCLVPYKRYESTCLEEVVSEEEAGTVVAADDSTLYRWRSWYNELTAYWCGALFSIAVRFSSTTHGGFVHTFIVCTPHNWTNRWRCAQMAGESCPSHCQYEFMATYPFCILVRRCFW